MKHEHYLPFSKADRLYKLLCNKRLDIDLFDYKDSDLNPEKIVKYEDLLKLILIEWIQKEYFVPKRAILNLLNIDDIPANINYSLLEGEKIYSTNDILNYLKLIGWFSTININITDSSNNENSEEGEKMALNELVRRLTELEYKITSYNNIPTQNIEYDGLNTALDNIKDAIENLDESITKTRN